MADELTKSVPQDDVPLENLSQPSVEDIALCCRVLEYYSLDEHAEEYKSTPVRNLRTALTPYFKMHERRLFQGMTVGQYIGTMQKKIKDAAKQAKQNHDRQLINHARLREQRIQQRSELEAKLQDGSDVDSLQLICDGPADAHIASSEQALLEATPASVIDSEGGTDSIGHDSKPNGNNHRSRSGSDDDDDVTGELVKPRGERLVKPRACYQCKIRFLELHHFYDQLCPDCAGLNYRKRYQTSNLNGFVAIVTGGRIKIGFQVALKLLRAGATVVVTTRFRADAADRFSREKDFETWQSRLHLYALDMRFLAGVHAFCDSIKAKFSRLDIIINNACQTVRRPPAYYSHLVEREQATVTPAQSSLYLQAADSEDYHANAVTPGAEADEQVLSIPSLSGNSVSALSQQKLIEGDEDIASFPKGAHDAHGNQVDTRDKTSWVLKLAEVSTHEATEVFAVNTLSPFILNANLKCLMEVSPQPHRYIVNVSAMEGKFYRYKNDNHPHTNMAKAALNMMTRTSAQDYKRSQIYMTSVDTGWINDENPLGKAVKYAEKANFQTPIDEVDAAARILDPVFVGELEGTYIYGKFLKDYAETEW